MRDEISEEQKKIVLQKENELDPEKKNELAAD